MSESDKIFSLQKISAFEDPITEDTNCNKMEFHYCKINRRQDVARKKKIRKIEWMRKMYVCTIQKLSIMLKCEKISKWRKLIKITQM